MLSNCCGLQHVATASTNKPKEIELGSSPYHPMALPARGPSTNQTCIAQREDGTDGVPGRHVARRAQHHDPCLSCVGWMPRFHAIAVAHNTKMRCSKQKNQTQIDMLQNVDLQPFNRINGSCLQCVPPQQQPLIMQGVVGTSPRRLQPQDSTLDPPVLPLSLAGQKLPCQPQSPRVRKCPPATTLTHLHSTSSHDLPTMHTHHHAAPHPTARNP